MVRDNLLNLLSSIYNISLKQKYLLLVSSRISPIGIMFLVASKLLEISDFGALVGTLGWYFMTVILGLTIHGFGTLSVIYFVCTRELPFKALSQMGQVAVTAFGTASR